MNHYIEIIRPVNCLMALLGVLIGIVLTGSVPFEGYFAMISVFLICAGGMVINDYFDSEIDKINRPKRPIPSGFEKKHALYYSIGLFLVGIILSFFVNIEAFVISIAATLLLVAYSYKLKKMLFVGNFIVSFLAGLTLIYGGVVNNEINTVLILALIAMFANIGREIYKTIEDVMGDKDHGVNSIPIKYGIFKARMIASVFVGIAIILSFLPFILLGFDLIYLVLTMAINIGILVSIKKKRETVILKYAMIMYLLNFLIQVFI